MKFSLQALSVKNLLPRTLFGRSLLILVTPVLLIQLISTYMFFDRHWNKMTGRLAYAVAGEIALVAEEIEQGADDDEISRIAAVMASNLGLLVGFNKGQVLDTGAKDDQGNSVVARTLGRAVGAKVRRPYQIKVDMKEKWIEVSVQLENGVLQVSSPQRRLFSSSGYIFLLWMISSSIILLAVAILFMRNQIRPIRRLAIAAERFGKGRDVPASFKPEGAYEIRQAARAFLDMHERIKRQIQQRTAMLAGVSHDLRTPLTRMKLQVAMLGDGPDIDALKSDIQDMEHMIAAYLDFARGEGSEKSETVNVREVMETIVMNARRQGAEIDFTMDETFSMSLRPVAFKRCISNLITNARKYGGGHIWVAVRQDGDVAEITIEDDGPGIPVDKREDVFKPFYRVEPSRNPATGGVGLGLPISQDIVHGHGGEIHLEDSRHGGLRVVIRLPV